jgi:hypothetical protein
MRRLSKTKTKTTLYIKKNLNNNFNVSNIRKQNFKKTSLNKDHNNKEVNVTSIVKHS